MIVIVNYRSGALVVDCLNSLVGEIEAHPSTHVLVVDNASGDNSADLIETAISEHNWSWARLIRSPVNGGFAAGNNVAFKDALVQEKSPDFFWLLNPDTRVQTGALTAFLSFLEHTPDAGIVGSKLLLGDGEAWPFAFRFPSILSELERGASFAPITKLLGKHRVPVEMPEVAAPIDWVSGASMFIKRQALQAVGLMDDGYFLYFEETDFCLKAAELGWTCWYLPDATVLHIAGQSTGVHDESTARLPRYWYEARRRYFIENHGKAYAIAADIAWLAGHTLRTCLQPLRKTRHSILPHATRDIISNSALFNSSDVAQARPSK